MKKIGFISDLHLGLTTNDLDRTNEIISVCFDFVKYVVKNKLNYVVFGGDIFHNNNPSEFLIGQFLRVLNLLQKYNKKTYIIVGNHDAITSESRKSCLDFINKLTFYPDIKLISDIKCFKIFDTDIGKIYFTFIPHITKAHLEDSKYNTTQKYIDGKAKSVLKKVNSGNHNIVFSHLNVKGVIPSIENNFLKKSSVFLPEIFLDGIDLPVIIQGHIHSKNVVDNINIVGSPIYVTFGETDKNKYFSVINVPDTFGEKSSVEFIKTNAIKFLEFTLDFTNYKDSMLDIFDSDEFLNKVKGKIIKLNITVDEEFKSIEWDKILKNVIENCVYLKPVVPKVIRKKIRRDENQRIDLCPVEAVKVWFTKNKTKNIQAKFKLAKKIIMECDENT